jgi:hypothetical protein
MDAGLRPVRCTFRKVVKLRRWRQFGGPGRYRRWPAPNRQIYRLTRRKYSTRRRLTGVPGTARRQVVGGSISAGASACADRSDDAGPASVSRRRHSPRQGVWKITGPLSDLKLILGSAALFVRACPTVKLPLDRQGGSRAMMHGVNAVADVWGRWRTFDFAFTTRYRDRGDGSVRMEAADTPRAVMTRAVCICAPIRVKTQAMYSVRSFGTEIRECGEAG